MADGSQVHRLTLRALVRKGAMVPCGTDLFGEGVRAYEIPAEQMEEIQDAAA